MCTYSYVLCGWKRRFFVSLDSGTTVWKAVMYMITLIFEQTDLSVTGLLSLFADTNCSAKLHWTTPLVKGCRL